MVPERPVGVTITRPECDGTMSDPELDSVRLQALLNRMRTGDRDAEDRLLRAVIGRFRNLARRMLQSEFRDLRNVAQTGDVVQESLLRLLRALKQVTPETTRDFFNLAAEQIRRQLLDLARRHRRDRTEALQLRDESSSSGNHPPDPAPPPVDLDLWEQFHRAVAELPIEQREVVGLTFYHGWTKAQIAELFGVDERTVRRRWKAACKTLNDALGGRLP
jgi:RNA polymerase sigma factor (TIGR02999 family)